jgi:hypothetical protein
LLGPSFGGLIFLLSWSHVACGGLVELTWVDSNFFPLIFYDFFSISSFCIKLFSLELCYFFTFLIVWLFRERVGKVIPDWLRVFFIELRFFLLGHPFEFFFIPISYHGLLVLQMTSSWLEFSSSILYFLKFFFVFIFDIRLLDLERYNFLSFFFCEFFRSHFSSHNLVNLIWIVLDYCPLNILFSIGKSLVRLAM